MIRSNGNVLLEAADKVLACGSFTSKFLFTMCFDTQPGEPGTGTVFKSHTWKIFSNKTFVSFIFFRKKVSIAKYYLVILCSGLEQSPVHTLSG